MSHHVRTKNEHKCRFTAADCPQVPVLNHRKEPNVINYLPKCHLLQLKYRGPDLLPPITQTETCIGGFSHNLSIMHSSNAINLPLTMSGNLQPVWPVCLPIHLPGCFWRWVSGFWRPPHSRCLSPAGYTTGMLKKPLHAAPRLCLKTKGASVELYGRRWMLHCSSSGLMTRTFLEAAFYAVGDGHPSLGDKLIQNPCGHCRFKPIQCSLSGFSTAEIWTNECSSFTQTIMSVSSD